MGAKTDDLVKKAFPQSAAPLTPTFTAMDYAKFFSAGALCCTM